MIKTRIIILFYMFAGRGGRTSHQRQIFSKCPSSRTGRIFNFLVSITPSSSFDYTVFFFAPIDVSMLPTAQMKAKTAKAPSEIVTGFLYPAVHG